MFPRFFCFILLISNPWYALKFRFVNYWANYNRDCCEENPWRFARNFVGVPKKIPDISDRFRDHFYQSNVCWSFIRFLVEAFNFFDNFLSRRHHFEFWYPSFRWTSRWAEIFYQKLQSQNPLLTASSRMLKYFQSHFYFFLSLLK